MDSQNILRLIKSTQFVAIALSFILGFYCTTLHAFDPAQANETLSKLSIKLSIQNLVAADLEEAAQTLIDLKMQAEQCVRDKKLEIEKYDEVLPKIDPQKPVTLTPDQQFLLKKKVAADNVLSECRLFILRADEAIEAFKDTAQTLKTKKIFSKKEILYEELLRFDELFLNWYNELSLEQIKSQIGVDALHKTLLHTLIAVLLLSSAFSVWLWHVLQRFSKKIIVDSEFDKVALNLILTFKHYCIPSVIFILLFVTSRVFEFYDGVPNALSELFAIGAIFTLAVGITRFCFLPPSPALPFCDISKKVAKRLVNSINLLLLLAAVAFADFYVFYVPDVHQVFFGVVGGLTVTLFAIVLLDVLIVTMSAPKFLSEYKLFRNAGSGLIIMVMMVIIVTEWTGYQEFARYLLVSTFSSLLIVFMLWFAYKVFVSLLVGFMEKKYKWQRDVYRYLDLADDTTPIEITALRLFAFLMFWSSVLLALNEIWSISELWSQQVNKSFVEGFMVAESKVIPLRIILSILFLSVGLMCIRAIKKFMYNKAQEMSKEVQEGHIMIMGYVFFTAVLLFALIIAGVNLQGLALIAGALSVGIGFGLQSIVNNFVSGLILLFERPIKKGDRIIVGDKEGFVTHIGVRSTRVNTIDKADVLVPNAELINANVTNFMYNNKKWLITIPIGVAYGTDIELARKCLYEIARSHDDIIQEGPEAPSVFFMSFGDSALIFELWVVIKNVNRKFFVKTDLNFMIDKVFAENGIVIAFPQTDLNINEPIPIQIEHKYSDRKDPKDES